MGAREKKTQLALKNIQMDDIRFLVIKKTGKFPGRFKGIEQVQRRSSSFCRIGGSIEIYIVHRPSDDASSDNWGIQTSDREQYIQQEYDAYMPHQQQIRSAGSEKYSDV